MAPRVLIIGTGLIGSSFGLALKALRGTFGGMVLGWDANPAELGTALRMGAVDEALPRWEDALAPERADVYVLATPVMPILDWMGRLAPALGEAQIVTDVGSTKLQIAKRAEPLYNGPGQAAFLPGHPMAGKESGGAAQADPALFRGATWLLTPLAQRAHPGESALRQWVEAMGASLREIEPAQHDVLCAWVSHLPQMLSTALAALLEETFAHDAQGRAAMEAIGGRALRECTRLGASPFSMWRDIALTNTEPIAATLAALEGELAHLRENLRTPGLRDAFTTANRFRRRGDESPRS